jgi:hypothetical protein
MRRSSATGETPVSDSFSDPPSKSQRKRDMQLVMDTTLTQGLLRLLHQALKASDWLQVPQLQQLPARLFWRVLYGSM